LFSAAYTGFIYEGPALVKAINKKILKNAVIHIVLKASQ
jgi:dihydroorotate dehydrogenase